MDEKELYTEEQLEKLEKLRRLSAAERRTKKDLIENNKRYKNEPFAVGEKIFYNHLRGVVTDRIKKERVGNFSKQDKFYFLYTVKCGIEIFDRLQRYELGKRTVQNYDDVEVTDQIKNTDTKSLLSWYRRVSYGRYHEEDYYGQPANLELQLKAELSRREHIPTKKEGSLRRRLKAKRNR